MGCLRQSARTKLVSVSNWHRAVITPPARRDSPPHTVFFTPVAVPAEWSQTTSTYTRKTPLQHVERSRAPLLRVTGMPSVTPSSCLDNSSLPSTTEELQLQINTVLETSPCPRGCLRNLSGRT